MIASITAVVACGDVATTTGDVGREAGTGHDGGPVGLEDANHDSHASGDVIVSMRVPTNHRPDDSQCATVPAAGNCDTAFGERDAGPQFPCTSDSDCSAGKNGRCNTDAPAPFAGCQCDYDACAGDTDCTTGDLCVCHGSPYDFGAGNTCLAGNCRVDSDCGSHGNCSPSESLENCGSIGGYYCHTSEDTCIDDTDCTTNEDAFPVCIWSSTAGHWTCALQEGCG
jgi:hypothetical protein